MDFGQNPYAHYSACKTEFWAGCDECAAEAQERQTLGGVSVIHIDLSNFLGIVYLGGTKIPF